MEIAVLVCTGVSGSASASVLEIFDTSNAIADLISEPARWNVTPVGFEDQVRTSAGHLVDCEPVTRIESAELLVVPAVNERDPEALIELVSGEEYLPVCELIAKAHKDGLEIASACGGTFLLAEAGVLDGLRATTAWWLAPAFHIRYHRVRLDQSSMVVHDEDIITAGAAFAHLDLALALVRTNSPAVADLVSHYLVADERPSQTPYILPSVLAQHDDTVAAFERWASNRLNVSIKMPEAARQLGIGERTLQRAVLRTTGKSPIRYVQDLRIERAIHLLRTTNLPLDLIARRVGYNHATTLGTLLRRHTGKSITAIRTTPLS